MMRLTSRGLGGGPGGLRSPWQLTCDVIDVVPRVPKTHGPRNVDLVIEGKDPHVEFLYEVKDAAALVANLDRAATLDVDGRAGRRR